jgi:hypothetical protein
MWRSIASIYGLRASAARVRVTDLSYARPPDDEAATGVVAD